MASHRGSRMATWVDLDRLSPSVLRHLAAAKENASRPRYDDTEAMAEELAAMLMAGTSSNSRLVPAAPHPSPSPSDS